MRDPVDVQAGNSAEINISWFDTDGEADTPETVRYQVFDKRTGEAVSEVQEVADLASVMSFTIPAADIPNIGPGTRKLIVVIEGAFSESDTHTELVELHIQRGYALA